MNTGGGLFVCGQCRVNGGANVETFFKPVLYTLKEPHSFSYVAAGKNTCYGVEKGVLYYWDTSGEEGVNVVQGLEGLKVNKIFTHYELPVTCILTEDGQVYSWGKSDNFITGLGTETTVNTPLRMECFDAPVHQVSIGSNHGVAVTRKGTVYTWGLGLGLGIEFLPFPHANPSTETDVFAVPSKVARLTTKVTDVAAGDNFSIVSTESGEVWTWGEGASGKLGHGDQKDQREPTQVAVLKGKHIVQVAAGEKHCLALSKDGEVFSWGSNSNGELGVEGSPLKCVPTAIVNLTNISQISCVRSSNFAVTREGETFTWGQNSWGQLAQGHTRNIPIPAQVNIPDAKIGFCTMGFNHSLFLLASSYSVKAPRFEVGLPYHNPPSQFYNQVEEGQLWCTGSVLGTGNEVGDDMTIFTPAKNFQARQIVNGATGIRAGYATTADGWLWTWGKATLGNGPSTDQVTKPTKMWDLEGMKVVQVCASPDDWYMALTADGRLYSWGDSSSYRTGLGVEVKQVHPRLVEGFEEPVARFAIGSSHGVAVSTDYAVYTWGTGRGLGNGGRQNTERTPKRVVGMEQFTVCDVAAGTNFTALLTRDGRVLTWGEGCSGKLGHGNEDSVLIPTEITKLSGTKIVQVGCGGEYCVALSDKGQVYSWGYGSDGCLGIGSNFLDNLYEPHCIPYLEKICLIYVTTVSVFAISSEGGLYAWGKPHLGVGSGRTMTRPVRVASLQKVRVQGVAAGEWQTFVWVSSHEVPPPPPPSAIPWPKATPRGQLKRETSSAETLRYTSSSDLSRTVSKLSVKGEKEMVTAVDPERFAAHESYLKKMPYMYRFFPEDSDMDEFAALGKVEDVKDFLNQSKFWGPTPEQAKAIQHAVHATKQDEKVIKSWMILAINSKDFEHERIFIVTDKAHYRIKYDPKKEEVMHAKRYPVRVVYQVLAGRFKDGNPSFSSKLRAPMYDKQYGFQVWTSNPKEWTPTKYLNPLKKARPPFYLYRPFGMGHDLPAQELVCLEICLALQATIHWYRNGLRPIDYIHEFAADAPKANDNFPAFPCRKVDFIERCLAQSNGLIAYAVNKLKK